MTLEAPEYYIHKFWVRFPATDTRISQSVARRMHAWNPYAYQWAITRKVVPKTNGHYTTKLYHTYTFVVARLDDEQVRSQLRELHQLLQKAFPNRFCMLSMPVLFHSNSN